MNKKMVAFGKGSFEFLGSIQLLGNNRVVGKGFECQSLEAKAFE